MNIEALPITVINNFMRGDSCAIGQFRTDGEYLYLNNEAIAYRDKFGECFRIDQPTATPPPKQSILKKIHRFLVGFSWPFIAFWIAATTSYLMRPQLPFANSLILLSSSQFFAQIRSI